MINNILDLYNKTLNKEYKDFVFAGNKTSKVVGKFFHITPFNLGLMANLKPQITECITTVESATGKNIISYRQKILYCGRNVYDCFMLAPSVIWKNNERIYIYKTNYNELGYISNLFGEVLVFHTLLAKQIGYIDNQEKDIFNEFNKMFSFGINEVKEKHEKLIYEYFSFVEDKITLYQ
ncbi:hypothetical protein QYQ99_27380 [Comamonas testosteroni]|uniref:hypothetical protein n=1 Tax=Comamonas testosteroni TaxID=285 RepID=UPI00265EB80A|nr:hypothetical protein [Comamonas testosteroni]WKL15986.1 hypothetical protein QYQ99_27380 [Comamonas testosteroni]